MWYIYIYILEVITVMDDLLTKSQVSGMNIYTSVYQFFGVAIQASKCFCASTTVNLHGPPNDGCNNKHSYFGLTNLSMYFLSCSASLKTAIQPGKRLSIIASSTSSNDQTPTNQNRNDPQIGPAKSNLTSSPAGFGTHVLWRLVGGFNQPFW